MDILTGSVLCRTTVKNSIFISELTPCTSQKEARMVVKDKKSEYADASHTVHAFITGPNAEVMGMSDDGEPTGTAGRPILDVLKGRKCTNLVLTVTRWFGGTLLGTGGLVKAYGSCAKSVIEKADALGLLAPYVEECPFRFECSYTECETIRRALAAFTITGLQEMFGERVDFAGNIRTEEYEALSEKLRSISFGRIKLEE
ncbi:MAG: IMPACT family protein [Treponema sp.]